MVAQSNWSVNQLAADPIIRSTVERGFNNLPYRLYLYTEWWKHRRAIARRADHDRCTICNGTHNLQVHHLTYLNLWAEEEMDLTLLCNDCHRSETLRLAAHPDPRRRGHAPTKVPIPPAVLRIIRAQMR